MSSGPALLDPGNLARFDVMVNRSRVARVEPVPMWRVWFVIAIVGATGTAAAWHVEHDADPSCVVCKLRHQSLADPAEDLQVSPLQAPEPATRLSVTTWVPADSDAQVPTRAPPRS